MATLHMNIQISEPQSTKATKVLATIGLVAILFVLLFLAVQFVQFAFPEAAQSPAAVIESNDRFTQDDEPILSVAEPKEIEEPVEATLQQEPPEPNVPAVTQPVVYPYADLRIRVENIGFMSGNVFFSSPIIDSNIRGGIQFTVQNIGTTPSQNWSMRVNLPNGEIYNLTNQAGLMPNEVSVVTIGFDPRKRDGVYTFNATLNSSGESNTSNNYITGSMTFVD